ncbi:hypothetical protein [Vibrio scophthalmi]|uniref:Lipoprotein n=1 Tax=Vibrio scophthalmi LMG 19158 TaxID=870967 RepID=F9RW45_9VIBR|nr:hypothetical protein [Vibrio scophthalmi]EGU29133.1 hypothetical protein VIS19158_20466 [Vibrio scophthalmi LMG 19158]
MKPFIPLITFLFGCVSTSLLANDVMVDTRCFSSPNGKINLELKTYLDRDIGWVGGQVRYKQSKHYIPLVYKGSETINEVPDRPWEFKHTWLEVVDGKINGRYEFHSQGAVMWNLHYIHSSGRSVDLSNQSYNLDDNGQCIWSSN